VPKSDVGWGQIFRGKKGKVNTGKRKKRSDRSGRRWPKKLGNQSSIPRPNSMCRKLEIMVARREKRKKGKRPNGEIRTNGFK